MIIRPATITELNEWWDNKINENIGDNSWVVWKKSFIEDNISGKRTTFFATDNGEYIGQCTLLFEGRDKKLSGNGKAEIIKLEIIEKERGKGIATQFFHIAKKLTLFQEDMYI